MAQYSLESASIIANGTTLRLIFPAASWSTPTVDVSSVYLVYERSDIDLASGFDIYRRVVIDSTTVLGSSKVQVDCHCTGNDGTTNSTRNPMHDGHTNIRVLFDADIVTEGADGTNAETAFSVTATSVATGPVFTAATMAKPSRTYDPTDLASGTSPTGMAIQVESTTIARPGVLTAAVDTTSLAVAGVADPYMSGHFEWELLDTSNNPITEYALDAVTDPVFGGSLHPYSDFRGPELRCMLWADETVRVKCTGYWKTASGEVSASATQDITVRDIEWGTDIWIDPDGGDSANDGLDPWGFALTAGTYNSGTRTLTQAGKFTGYDHTAATAPTEPWRRYNYIALTGGDYVPSAGTPVDWVKNEAMGTTAGVDVLTTLTNSGSAGDFSASGQLIDIINVTGTGFSYYIKDGSGSPSITRSDAGSTPSRTIIMAYIPRDRNSQTLYEQSGSITLKEQSVDIVTESGTETVNFTDHGGFGSKNIISVRITQGTGSGATVSIWLDGTLDVDEQSLTGDTPVSVTNDIEINKATFPTTDNDLVELVSYNSALTDAQIQEVEGYFAHGSLFSDDPAWATNLDASHPYKDAGPGPSGLYQIESKTSNDAIVLSSGQTVGATTGITSSSGPKDNGTASAAVTRARIKAGTEITTYPTDAAAIASIYPYGVGVNPVYSSRGTLVATGFKLQGSGANQAKDHFVQSQVDGIDTRIVMAGSASSGTDAVMNNGVFHNCRITQPQGELNIANTNAPTGNGSKVSGLSFIGVLIDAAGSRSAEHLFSSEGELDGSGNGIQADHGFGLVGSFLANNCSDNILDHHIYPSGFCGHRIYSLNRFGEYGNGNYNINTNAGGDGDGSSDVPNKNVLFWRNEFSNALRGVDLSNTDNERIERGGTKYPFDSVVISECSFHDLSQQAILYYSCNSLRVAHCQFWDVGDSHIRPDDSLGSVVAHNNVHTKASSDGGAVVSLPTTWTDDDTVSRKATLRWQDDVITDNRTQPEVLRCDVTKFTSSITNGSDISNVTVYVPNDTSSGEIIYNTATTSYMTVAAFETATGLSDTFNIVVLAPANPTISNITPADNATGVLASQVVSIQFDETVKYLDGSVLIEVYQSGVVVASDRIDNGTINVGDRTQWSIGGLLVGLADGAYSIRIASGGFGSIATSIPFAGITDDTTWNFTIGGTVTTKTSASSRMLTSGLLFNRRNRRRL